MRTLIVCALAALVLTACKHGEGAGPSPSAQARARAHLEAGEAKEALPILEELHRARPTDLAIARDLTQAHVKLGRTDALIARLQAVPSPTVVTHYMLGLAYFARTADADGPAIEAFEQAVALAPNEAELHYRLGLVLVEAEHYDRAAPSLKRAVELAPERAAYNLPLAKALARTQDPRGAMAALSRVVKSRPSPHEVAVARALVDRIADPFAGFPKAAEGRLEQGLKLLHEADLPQQAILPFEEIAREFPDVAVVHALLGLCYQRLDDAGRAVDEFRRAIELAPYDGKNHFYLAELYLSRQRTEQAQASYQKAVELNPLLDEAWFRLGDIALERRELDVAKEHFRILTWLGPDAIAPRGKLAAVHQVLGEWDAADHELRRILDRHPERTEFHLRMGLLHTERFTRSSKPEERKAASAEAQRWLTQVLEVEPENAMASRALEVVREK